MDWIIYVETEWSKPNFLNSFADLEVLNYQPHIFGGLSCNGKVAEMISEDDIIEVCI